MTSPKNWAETLKYFAKGVAETHQIVDVSAPTPSQFTAFINLRLCPSMAVLEASRRLNRLLILKRHVERPQPGSNNNYLPTPPDDELQEMIDQLPKDLVAKLSDDDFFEHFPEDSYIYIHAITRHGVLKGHWTEDVEESLDILALEKARNRLSPNCRPHSFLVPLMEAWVAHPELRPIDIEKRRSKILSEPIRYAIPTQAALPMPTGTALPDLGRQPLRTSYLPGLEPPPGVVVPVLPLQVAKVSTAGQGGPITPRLWYGCQMTLPLNRRTGEEVRLPLTVREVCSWLWPNGWNRGRDLPRLREGLRDLYQLGVFWDHAEWLLVRPVKLPTMETPLDDHILVDVTALPGSDRGPLIDTQRLWQLGVMAGAPWRMWIRLAYIWDAVKTHNGGNRVYATRPEVKRGEGAVILDRQGRPVLDRHNKPITDWSDKRAVRTGQQERHPQASRVPSLGMRDLALLGFDNAEVPAGTLRRRAAETRSWLTKIERMGFVALEYEGKEIRILETYPQLEPNSEYPPRNQVG